MIRSGCGSSALSTVWSAAAARRLRDPSGGRGQPLNLSTSDPLPSSWTSVVALQAKLSPAPGDDGAPPDQQTEAQVDELNETIAEGPDEGQSFESWTEEIEGLADALNDGPDPCPTFDTPSTGECPLVGGVSECPPPCLNEQPDGCDIDSLPFHDADGLYDFVYSIASRDEAVDREAVDLVQYAWAVLLDNLDLVDWIACLFYGETSHDSSVFENLGEIFGVAGSVAECLTEKIQGKAPDVTIRFTHDSGSGDFWASPNPVTGGTIHIPITGKVWQTNYVEKYKNAAPGSADQFCIVADLAATLLHELVHSCLTAGSADAPGGDDDPNLRSTSYLIENNFRWALGQRYPCLCPTSNCGFYYDDRLWRNDGTSYSGEPPW